MRTKHWFLMQWNGLAGEWAQAKQEGFETLEEALGYKKTHDFGGIILEELTEWE